MTAEAIARVVADLRDGRVRPLVRDEGLFACGLEMAQLKAKVVDATSIYESIVAKDEPIYIYEDHPSIAPPFTSAHVCYQNEHGNVIDMVACALDRRDDEDARAQTQIIDTLETQRPLTQPKGWETAEPVDWARVRWTIDTLLWVGGRSHGKPFPTAGPMHCWRFAVYDTGEPADLHWVDLVPDYPMENWDMAHLVLLGTLNFLNCRNVDLVEPTRPRAQSRRLARTGVQVYELTVFPAGRSTRRGAGGGSGAGVPLASVRGHFAHYGDCCPGAHEPRGLAFGRLEGRFWIPQHARGNAEMGEHDSTYRVVTT